MSTVVNGGILYSTFLVSDTASTPPRRTRWNTAQARLANRIFRKFETPPVNDFSLHWGKHTHPIKINGERGEDKTEEKSHHGTGFGSSPPLSEVTRQVFIIIGRVTSDNRTSWRQSITWRHMICELAYNSCNDFTIFKKFTKIQFYGTKISISHHVASINSSVLTLDNLTKKRCCSPQFWTQTCI